MSKQNLLGYTSRELEDLVAAMGDKAYRGRQLFRWLYKTRQYDFNLITDLSKDLRRRLHESYDFTGLSLARSAVSEDGTKKFVFRLYDGQPLETVLIPDESGRSTVCLSTQVGCALNCGFCATGKMGFRRNLSVGEIIGQLIYLRDWLGDNAFTNIVMMGMGEPLLNFDNVVKAVSVISAGDGLSVSAKKITVSTVGILDKIRRLADLKLKVRLAVSLNAAIQDKRIRIMPIAQSCSLEELSDTLRYYTEKTSTRVTFEYILFDGFNDSIDDVMAISRYIQGIPCKINLLAYNPVEGAEFGRPSDEKVDWFARQLYPRAPAVTVRKSRGRDIDAACGQLAARHLMKE
ncbi:MAG: 23S rRNA (adenine(2503)-C(2))-methyltransferase RlmN [Candidatus Zixiibacteriota bacterium]|nr:MAG: 23S rRNA (adenine(2503)-C(2))-methyltransferase RlmN [candidate division Zixibacteria bacterium]